MAPIYLDCNATTPLDARVGAILRTYLEEEYGNEGSRTHEWGARAKKAVQRARDQVARVVSAQRDEVIFTSGATESNNLAVLGLIDHGLATGRRHVITTSIEHKAVLEPCEELERLGFEVTVLPVGSSGRLDIHTLKQALRPETLVVSVMHANNETGIQQPLSAISDLLKGHPAYFHTDAAQSFGKELAGLRNQRIDLISVSGHKLFAPKGVGALIVRRRGYERIPLRPRTFGGGQERGLRPGTLPVALIAALGEAAERAELEQTSRADACSAIRRDALNALTPLNPRITGDIEHALPHVLNLRFDGLDSEALILGIKDLISISNGSACTSSSYKPSHVLKAMGMSDDEANGCVRFSWSHMTPQVDWESVSKRIAGLLQ